MKLSTAIKQVEGILARDRRSGRIAIQERQALAMAVEALRLTHADKWRGRWRVLNISPAEARTFARMLKDRFPWIGTNRDVGACGQVSELVDLYRGLRKMARGSSAQMATKIIQQATVKRSK